MPAADVVLLPLCIGLSLVGVVVAVLAFVRGRRGRGLQALGFALAVVALQLTGLLRLLWDGVVAVVRWATGNVFDVQAWVGFGLLALGVVLWVVGGVLARRGRRRTRETTAPGKAPGQVTAGSAPARQTRGRAPGKAAAPVDEDMAEIEALLKSRGIQ